MPIELPFIIDSLGEDYQFDDEYEKWGIDNSTPKPTATLVLKYKDIKFGIFYLTGVESKDLSKAKSLDVYTFVTDTTTFGKYEGQLININGITLGSTATDVKEALGEPDDINEVCYIYYRKGTQKSLITVLINDDNIVTGLVVRFKTEEENN